MNLPASIAIEGKGTIEYVYDALGIKLQKRVTEGNNLNATDYIDGVIYNNDTLQFFAHEEGRARRSVKQLSDGSSVKGFEYDFFLKDHLGNIRAVLTDQQDTLAYLASMENAYTNIETALFSNITETKYSKPAGYPADATTNPNDFVSRLNANSTINKKVGPSLILRVMAGDKLDVASKSYYEAKTQSYVPLSPLSDILTILGSGIAGISSGSKGTASELSDISGPLAVGVGSFLNSEPQGSPTKPKAYLNWMLLDEKFNHVSSASGYKMVGSAGVLEPLAFTGIQIPKNGYFMVWVSNEHRTGMFTSIT